MKKLIAYIFLFIFSFQVLPVKELGKMLFKSQLTEEVKESATSEKGDEDLAKLKKDIDPLHRNYWEDQQMARLLYLSLSLRTAMHQAERLPKHHVGDIFTPPPNC